MSHGLTLERVLDARALLRGVTRHTPLERSYVLSQKLGVECWLKLECAQVTGSFKARGALVALSKLSAEHRSLGVVTCSAGNHGKGVAWAAKRLGIHATIFVPSTVDGAKLKGMLALGAEVIRTEHPGFDDSEAQAKAFAAEAQRPWVSAFDDPWVMAGNGGSLALELLEDLPKLGSLVVPVGGGGLSGGLAWTLAQGSLSKGRADGQPTPEVIGVQHEGCPALQRSLDQGAALTRMPAIETLAGGIEGGLGERPFAALKEHVSRVTHVSEQDIHDAFRWCLREHQLLVEPTGCVAVAAALSGKLGAPGALRGPAVFLLCGRNVSLETTRALLAEG